MENSIFAIKDYGRITIQLKDIMEKQKITRNKIAKSTNTAYNTIDGYYKFSETPITSVDLDVLAKICYVLQCEVGDILKYEKPR